MLNVIYSIFLSYFPPLSLYTCPSRSLSLSTLQSHFFRRFNQFCPQFKSDTRKYSTSTQTHEEEESFSAFLKIFRSPRFHLVPYTPRGSARATKNNIPGIILVQCLARETDPRRLAACALVAWLVPGVLHLPLPSL